jgi:hypothetical protein
MTEATRKKMVYLALVIAVIWGWYNLSGPVKPPRVTAPKTIEPISTAVSPGSSKPGAEVASIQKLPWGEDPFRPTTIRRPVEIKPIWVVTGIVFNDVSPLAYVNKTPVQPGDTVDDATVVKIEKRSVTLNYKGTQFEIFLSRG